MSARIRRRVKRVGRFVRCESSESRGARARMRSRTLGDPPRTSPVAASSRRCGSPFALAPFRQLPARVSRDPAAHRPGACACRFWADHGTERSFLPRLLLARLPAPNPPGLPPRDFSFHGRCWSPDAWSPRGASSRLVPPRPIAVRRQAGRLLPPGSIIRCLSDPRFALSTWSGRLGLPGAIVLGCRSIGPWFARIGFLRPETRRFAAPRSIAARLILPWSIVTVGLAAALRCNRACRGRAVSPGLSPTTRARDDSSS